MTKGAITLIEPMLSGVRVRSGSVERAGLLSRDRTDASSAASPRAARLEAIVNTHARAGCRCAHFPMGPRPVVGRGDT